MNPLRKNPMQRNNSGKWERMFRRKENSCFFKTGQIKKNEQARELIHAFPCTSIPPVIYDHNSILSINALFRNCKPGPVRQWQCQ